MKEIVDELKKEYKPKFNPDEDEWHRIFYTDFPTTKDAKHEAWRIKILNTPLK